MLESLHVRPAICKQIRSGPLGSWVDPFIVALAQRGHAPSVQRRHLRAAAVFGAWMKRHRISIGMIDEALVAVYCREHRRWQSASRPGGRVNGVVTGVRLLAAYLWEQGVAARQAHVTPETDLDRWVTRFDEHLARVHGASAGTRRIYGRYVRTLLTACWPHAQADWSTFTADRLISFVREQAATLSQSANRAPVTATRSFVRFLIAEGVVRGGLDGVIPGVRQWKLASLPRTLTSDEVQRILETVDTSTSVGTRDHAILLLLSRLGLRAGEVAALRVPDIDWREGCLHIRPGKTGRERLLPLPQEVGAALVHVLKVRPAHAAREAVFVRARPPCRPLTASAITAIAQRVQQRADVRLSRRGAHAFRHTVASQLVQHGVSMKAVADILGHAELETTAIYAKLDVPTLLTVALPWPGGAQ
jgi:site-specific recombinase XerD